MKIKQIFKDPKEIQTSIKGWSLSVRGNNKIRFLVINDGSTLKNIQVVLKGDEAKKFYKIPVGSAIEVKGVIKLTPHSQQILEMHSFKTTVLKETDPDFPLQKQLISHNLLRKIPHLRHRTNFFKAVMRARSTLFQLIHDFLNKEGFLYLSSPILTSTDGEGVGEVFTADSDKGNFFNVKAMLAGTGQLHAEAYANGFGDVYTFGPTFRAEVSHTPKHAAEFWMLEPEMAFVGKSEIILFIDKMMKNIISMMMIQLPDEFDFFEQHTDKNIRNKLQNIIDNPIQIITYTDAIEKLKQVKNQFEFQDIEFGIDLATEHEKYLAEKLFQGPVAVVDYPKKIKAFYMKQNQDGKTVGAFDVLFPGIGEVVGGSERECDYNKLKTRVKELNLNLDDINWYLDLRRFGQYQSSGFGLGFERLLMYITGVDNIRDVLPYPRTHNNLKM